jgi:plastocyanin
VSTLPRRILGCLALLGVAATASPRGGITPSPRAAETTPTPAPSESVRGTAVTMDGVSFSPDRLVVRVGETITWTNKDPFPHNVTSSTGAFKSGDIAPDAQWTFRATAAGRFPYTCTLHPGMNGILIVEGEP